jgi:carbonic anhydrase
LDYDYGRNGQDWTTGQCVVGRRQSPVDLASVAKDVPVTGRFQYQYPLVEAPVELSNDGRTYTLEFRGPGFGGIDYNGGWYDLMAVKAHAFSEHIWAGVHTPVELQFMHKKHDSAELLVVSIPLVKATLHGGPMGFMQRREKQNSSRSVDDLADVREQMLSVSNILQAFLTAKLPDARTKEVASFDKQHTLDLGSMLQRGLFYAYPGSLTTPPCAEIVTWLVRATPLAMSEQEASTLHTAIFNLTANRGNYRTVQQLNGRGALKLQAEPWRQLAGASGSPDYSPSLGHVATPREVRVLAWANGALRIAKSAVDYVDAIAANARTASQWQVDALAK